MFWSPKKRVFYFFHKHIKCAKVEHLSSNLNFHTKWIYIRNQVSSYCPTNDQKNTYLFQTSLVFKYSHSKNNIKMSYNFYLTFLLSIANAWPT
jgi:hypothetical protein